MASGIGEGFLGDPVQGQAGGRRQDVHVAGDGEAGLHPGGSVLGHQGRDIGGGRQWGASATVQGGIRRIQRAVIERVKALGIPAERIRTIVGLTDAARARLIEKAGSRLDAGGKLTDDELVTEIEVVLRDETR